jgi:CheY-like chemotaxis protein
MKPEMYRLPKDDSYRSTPSLQPKGKSAKQLPIILLVDDDPDDADLFWEALDQITCEVCLVRAGNGKEALQYLYLHQPLPSLIVMDLNMPVMDGKETINEILKERKFKGIPIVVLSTSRSEQDQQFFDQRHLAYFSKPASSAELTKIVRELVAVCLQRFEE